MAGARHAEPLEGAQEPRLRRSETDGAVSSWTLPKTKTADPGQMDECKGTNGPAWLRASANGADPRHARDLGDRKLPRFVRSKTRGARPN